MAMPWLSQASIDSLSFTEPPGNSKCFRCPAAPPFAGLFQQYGSSLTANIRLNLTRLGAQSPAGLAKISRVFRRNRPAGRIKNWARETASGPLNMIMKHNYEQEKAWLRTRRPDEAVEAGSPGFLPAPPAAPPGFVRFNCESS